MAAARPHGPPHRFLKSSKKLPKTTFLSWDPRATRKHHKKEVPKGDETATPILFRFLCPVSQTACFFCEPTTSTSSCSRSATDPYSAVSVSRDHRHQLVVASGSVTQPQAAAAAAYNSGGARGAASRPQPARMHRERRACGGDKLTTSKAKCVLHCDVTTCTSTVR